MYRPFLPAVLRSVSADGWMGLVAALTLALVAGAASAGDCDVPFGLKARPDGPATEVGLGVLLLGLQSVKDADQVFEADVAVVTSWKDPRLSAVALGRSLADCRLEPGRIWNPQVQILNRIGGDTPLDEILVDEEGAVLHRRRFVGAFGARMALHDFPFDRQELSLALLSTHSPDEVVFRMDEERVGTLADLEGRGWERVGGGSRFEPTPQKLGRHGRTLAGATVSFGIARRSGFYVWKLMLPLTMIVFMAWGVFWLDPSHLSTQVGLSTSAALTFVSRRRSRPRAWRCPIVTSWPSAWTGGVGSPIPWPTSSSSSSRSGSSRVGVPIPGSSALSRSGRASPGARTCRAAAPRSG